MNESRSTASIADRQLFQAGEHPLTWDGADDHGRAVPRGVYFARVRYEASGFESAKKTIVVK